MSGLVHIVDGDALFRAAIEPLEARRLRGCDLCFGAALAGSITERKCPELHLPRCANTLLGRSSTETRLSELGSTLPIIFLTGHPDVRTTVRAIKAGADDVLTKPVTSDDLLRAIERAFAHHEVARVLGSKLDVIRAHIATLTPRERQVFELIVRGNMNKQGATERTIKAHRQRVMQVRTLAELVSLAERGGVFAAASEQTA